ncbi:MAG: TSUP family transporter [Qingshengfaniella sp.]
MQTAGPSHAFRRLRAGAAARVILAELHAGLGWPIVGFLTALSFGTSMLTAAFGLGGGIVMLAVLASLLPPPAIIPVHGVVQLGSNAGRAALFFRHADRAVLLPFTIGAVVGVVLGGSVVVQLPGPALKLALGLFILWTVVFKPSALFRRSAALVGLTSSVLTMFVGGTGPFVASFTRARGAERMAFIGTNATLMTIQHLLKTIAFAVLGFAFAPWLPVAALLILSGFLGTMAGRKILMRINEALFQKVLGGILILLALRLAVTGALGLMAGEGG